MPSRLSADSFPVPDSLPQSPECAACFGDPAVDFGVDIGAAQVGKVFYCLEGLSIHLDLPLVVSIQLELHFVLTTGDAGTVETH